MPQGGARIRSGPPPDPNSLHRERDAAKVTWHVLPRQCDTPAPRWPLPTTSPAETAMWKHVWTLPQAAMWRQQRQEAEVASYVRHALRADAPDASATDRQLVMRMRDSLGLTTAALLRNHWRIEPEAEAATRSTRTDDPDRAAAKAKLRLLARTGS